MSRAHVASGARRFRRSLGALVLLGALLAAPGPVSAPAPAGGGAASARVVDVTSAAAPARAALDAGIGSETCAGHGGHASGARSPSYCGALGVGCMDLASGAGLLSPPLAASRRGVEAASVAMSGRVLETPPQPPRPLA